MRFLLIFVCVLAVGRPSLADEPMETPAIVTLHKHDADVKKQFEKLTDSVALEQTSIVISLGKMAGLWRYGRFPSRERPVQNGAIVLSEVGDAFRFSVPHISTSYTVYRVASDSVTFFYEQETNFSSWGKNLITIDRGTFSVPLKAKK